MRKLCGILFLLFGFLNVAFAVQTECAVVKIEIKQKITIERQAFDAKLVVTNHLDNMSITNVKVDVLFSDADGNSILASSDTNDTNAKFYIRVNTMDGVDDVSGSGTIAPSAQAEIHWLIIPSPGAADNLVNGKLINIGALLTYTQNGQEEKIEIAPASVTVKPTPVLSLDYFITKDVYADDPTTPEIETAEPFTLGLLMKNTGVVPANNVKIETSQPKIVENLQGLDIGFSIFSTQINDNPAENTLLATIPVVPAQGTAAVRWGMLTTLAGTFVSITSTVSHAEDLGGQLTAIIKDDAIASHLLLGDVLVDLKDSDNVRDFLADDGTDAAHILRVYQTNGDITPVTDLSSTASLTMLSSDAGYKKFALTMSVNDGFVYADIADPLAHGYKVSSIVRSDGKALPAGNAWFVKVRDASNPSAAKWVNRFRFFDTSSTGQYTVVLEPLVLGPAAPNIQNITDKTVMINDRVSFLVEASDVNGDPVTLSIADLPAGASFKKYTEDNNLVRYIFDWQTVTSDKGVYPLVVTASNGTLSSTASFTITVSDGSDPTPPDPDPTEKTDLSSFIYLGQTMTDDKWSSVDISALNFDDPLIFAGIPTNNDAGTGIVLAGLAPNKDYYNLRFANWTYQNRKHGFESYPFMVVNAGVYDQLGDGSVVEAGRIHFNANELEKGIDFAATFQDAPNVYFTVENRASWPAVVKIASLSNKHLQIQLQDQEGTVSNGDMDVNYLAIYKGKKSLGFILNNKPFTIAQQDVSSEKSIFANDKIWLSEDQAADAETDHVTEKVFLINTSEGVFGQIASSNEADPVTLRYQLNDVDNTDHLWLKDFGDNQGWAGKTRLLADVNGDGKADIVGFGDDGVYVSLSTGTGFAKPTKWLDKSFGSKTDDWNSHNQILLMGDFNGDGKADIIGFKDDGVYVATSTGTGFTDYGKRTDQFGSPLFGLGDVRMLADINKDGKVDIIGFNKDGVYTAISDGNNFINFKNSFNKFGSNLANGGWDKVNDIRTVADTNSDGKADLVGFKDDGVYSAIGRGNGTFIAYRKNISDFDSNDWVNNKYLRLLADINGNKHSDIVGFYEDGVYIATADPSGFSNYHQAIDKFGYVDNWRIDRDKRVLADFTGNHKSDIIGFAKDGLYTATATGSSFINYKKQSVNFSTDSGWGATSIRTTADVDGDGQADVVGFSKDGVHVILAKQLTTP